MSYENLFSFVVWERDVPHIVMVTHGDRAAYLRRTVAAVLETNSSHTLTVVANAPAKESLIYLGRLQHNGWLNLIVNPENLGFARAANQGWKLRPEAAYCVHLGDDMLALSGDWLARLVDIIEHCPEVGIVGHSVEPVDWPVRMLNGRAVQVQPSNIGGCFLIPRRTREICGYYNEEMGLYGEEDALYGWKVRRAGLLCVYADHTPSGCPVPRTPGRGGDRAVGRAFAHLGEDTLEYRAWKDARRAEAIPIRDALIREYAAGRPLNN